MSSNVKSRPNSGAASSRRRFLGRQPSWLKPLSKSNDSTSEPSVSKPRLVLQTSFTHLVRPTNGRENLKLPPVTPAKFGAVASFRDKIKKLENDASFRSMDSSLHRTSFESFDTKSQGSSNFSMELDRLSFGSLNSSPTNISPDEAHAAKFKIAEPSCLLTADENRGRRRRRTFDHMFSSELDGHSTNVISDLMRSHYQEITDNLTPKQRMDIVLTRSKESGLNAEKLFSYFDSDKNGVITETEISTGLISLDPVRFRFTNDELTELFQYFSKNEEGTVGPIEFEDYCFSLPTIAWKAEKIRVLAARAEHARQEAEAKAAVAARAEEIKRLKAERKNKRLARISELNTPKGQRKIQPGETQLDIKMTHTRSISVLATKARKSALALAGSTNLNSSIFFSSHQQSST